MLQQASAGFFGWLVQSLKSCKSCQEFRLRTSDFERASGCRKAPSIHLLAAALYQTTMTSAVADQFIEPTSVLPLSWFFRVYRVALGLLAFFFLLPDGLFIRPSAGLDPSWAIAINLAFEQGMRFGQDFIFTFGPLGIFATRVPIGVSPLALMVWDAFLLGSIAAVLILALRETRTYLSVFLAFLAALLFTVVAPFTTALINTLFIIYLFLLIYHLRRGARWALALAVVYCWLIFFTKANMGLPALALMSRVSGVSADPAAAGVAAGQSTSPPRVSSRWA